MDANEALIIILHDANSPEEYAEACNELAGWLEDGHFDSPAVADLTGETCRYAQADALRALADKAEGRA